MYNLPLLLPLPSPRMKREVELGYHSWTVLCLGFDSWLSALCLCDFVPHSFRKSKLRSTQVASHWRGSDLFGIYCSGGGWLSRICLTVPTKMSRETVLSMLINIIHIIPTCPNCSLMNMASNSKNVKLAKFISCIFELF